VALRISVILASYGRPDILGELIKRLGAQTRPPDDICISVIAREDAPADLGGADLVIAPRGLCAQRNAGLNHVGDGADLIAFFDDDFVPAPDYLERLETFFSLHPDIGGVTGDVLRDGVTGAGLTFEDADAAIAANVCPAPQNAKTARRRNLYGCNMTFRRSAIGEERFDETLPLYGWLEDVDFSVRASRGGPMMWTDAVAGVHLGVKAGRVSGLRFGYSQIANPLYLHKKGTLSLIGAADNICSNFLANHVKMLTPQPYVDRLGRLKGNWIGLRDAVSGKLDPGKILSM